MQSLTLIVITSLKIVFIYEAMQDDMILHPLKQLLCKITRLLPVKIYTYIEKPLFACVFCMSSVWGCIFSANYVTFSFTWSFAWYYITLLFAIGGLNFLLGMWFGTQRLKRKVLREQLKEPLVKDSCDALPMRLIQKARNKVQALIDNKVYDYDIMDSRDKDTAVMYYNNMKYIGSSNAIVVDGVVSRSPNEMFHFFRYLK